MRVRAPEGNFLKSLCLYTSQVVRIGNPTAVLLYRLFVGSEDIINVRSDEINPGKRFDFGSDGQLHRIDLFTGE